MFRIVDARTVVDVVGDSVVVIVVVAQVAEAVEVEIELVGVESFDAVVIFVGNSVAVAVDDDAGIVLRRIVNRRTIVALVTDAVIVVVELEVIWKARTVVVDVGDAVVVDVVVAGVADSVAVAVFLAGIRNCWTVVGVAIAVATVED